MLSILHHLAHHNQTQSFCLQLTGLLLMQSWILCAGLTSSGKGVLQCSPTLPYLLCLEHIFQDAVEVEAEVVELHCINNQLPSVTYACSHDRISCQALHRPYACMQAAQFDTRSDVGTTCTQHQITSTSLSALSFAPGWL